MYSHLAQQFKKKEKDKKKSQVISFPWGAKN
jgi:hypothetical protein